MLDEWDEYEITEEWEEEGKTMLCILRGVNNEKRRLVR